MGNKEKVKIIAEIGCNHKGKIGIANKIIKAAFECGADYIKGQKRCPKECLSKDKYNEPYNSENSFGKTYGEHRECLELNKYEWKIILDNYTRKKVIVSVFDLNSAREMKSLGVEIFKIGSGQTNDIDLLKEISSYKKRVLLSTGMSTVSEIDKAFDIIKDCNPVLFHTTSCYPTEEKDVNLKIIEFLMKRYGCEIGLSGHYLSANGGIESAAVSMGVKYIERHFTLDRAWKGTDQVLSLEPEGLRSVVKAVRSAERGLNGETKKKVFRCEEECRRKFK